MRPSIRNKKNYITYVLRCFFQDHKIHLAIFGGIVFVGIVIGIIVAAGTEGADESSNIILVMRSGNYNVFGTYVKSTLLFGLCFLLLLPGLLNKWLVLFSFVVMFFAGYRTGISIAGVIIADKGTGVIAVIVNILPFRLVFLGILIVCACKLLGIVSEYGYYRRCNVTCKNVLVGYIKFIGISFCVFAIINIVVLLILPAILKFVIVV